MCSNKNYSFDDFLTQKPTSKELVEYIDFEKSWLSFRLVLAVRKQDLNEDIKALIPDKTIALLELLLNTPDLSRRKLLEDLRKCPNTEHVADNYEKNLMTIYEGTTRQCATESSTTQGISEYVGGKIRATPTESSKTQGISEFVIGKIEVTPRIDSKIVILEKMVFSLLEALQELKKAKKEESREKIQEMKQHLADKKLEQLSRSVSELQEQNKMHKARNKALMFENEKLESEIKKKERTPEQIESDSKVQHITESSSSKRHMEAKDEIFFENLTLKTLKSFVPSVLTDQSFVSV
uniref:Uncharacterized protein n=1 Tax=Amphimedon queenslandica TaxID=400682 RepID=A0A1X7UD95_AMPQE